MSEAKIEVKIGALSFSGEGSEKWLSEQLDKLLEKAPQLTAKDFPMTQHETSDGGSGASRARTGITSTLAAYLREKNATTNQVRKFLATAVWLHDHDNRELLSTSDVARALSDARQTDLTNPAGSLNQNVSKGFCSKREGNQFYVTESGRADIG